MGKKKELQVKTAQEAARFVAQQPTLESRVQALAAWYHQVWTWDSPLYDVPEWLEVAPSGHHVVQAPTDAQVKAWLACTKTPWHKVIREAAARSLALSAPTKTLLSVMDEVQTWIRAPNPEMQNAAQFAYQRLAQEQPKAFLAHWNLLVRSTSARDNVSAIRFVFRPPCRAHLVEFLEPLLSLCAAAKPTVVQDLGLAFEAELGYWGRGWEPHAPPLKPEEAVYWANFLDNLLDEAPLVYWVGSQDRSLLLKSATASVASDWPRGVTDLFVSRFLARPSSHVRRNGWVEWCRLLSENQLWEETRRTIRAQPKAASDEETATSAQMHLLFASSLNKAGRSAVAMEELHAAGDFLRGLDHDRFQFLFRQASVLGAELGNDLGLAMKVHGSMLRNAGQTGRWHADAVVVVTRVLERLGRPAEALQLRRQSLPGVPLPVAEGIDSWRLLEWAVRSNGDLPIPQIQEPASESAIFHWRRAHLVPTSIEALEACGNLPSELQKVAVVRLRRNAVFLSREGYWAHWRTQDEWCSRNEELLKRFRA